VFGRPGHVAKQIVIEGERTSSQRERWRSEILHTIEASDHAGADGAIAA